MSVLLLLVLFGVWMSWSPEMVTRHVVSARADLAIFFAGYVLLVILVGLWGRWLARRMAIEGVHASVGRFNWVIMIAQMFVPAWFSVGVMMLGWGTRVESILSPISKWQLEFPGLVLGVMPALAGWMGLWWAQYPVDRAMREQNLLTRLDSDMPVYAPPKFWAYFSGKFRMQLLFTAAPVLMIVALLDGVEAGLRVAGWDHPGGTLDMVMSLSATALVFLFAPEVLRRVLPTHRLADSELRTKLLLVADHAGIRCREILLWRTHHTVGNAAVMGLIAPVRYVLLSDLIVESLTDDELAAVFAHEAGHVVHNHMAWYAIFFVALGLGTKGVMHTLGVYAPTLGITPSTIMEVFPFVSVASLIGLFGYLSRRFERQADVYAARTMQAMRDSSSASAPVGPYGASVFNAALLRVAEVNNLPLEARGHFSGSLRDRLRFILDWCGSVMGSWLHGTMASRMRYISRISMNAELTDRFDRYMGRMRTAMIAVFIGFGLWGAYALWVEPSQPSQPVSSTSTPAQAMNLRMIRP